jgi:hypothetical protein
MSNMMTSEQAVEYLRECLEYRKFSEQWLSTQILRQAAIDHGVTVPEDVIQAEGDRQRRELRLERADQTLAWLASEQITPDQWERGIIDRLLRSEMAEHLFGNDIERVFIENRLNYDKRSLYRLEVTEKAVAQELFFEIEDGEISFFEAAHEYDVVESRRDRCGFEGFVNRFELPSDEAEAVFNAKPRQVLPPIETESGFILLWVDRIIPATLTDEIRATLLETLMDQWLAAELIRWQHYHSEALEKPYAMV